MQISNRQKDLVQTSFAKVLPIAGPAAALFYGKLFELEPDVRKLFRGDMAAQGQKLMSTLKIAVAGLDHLDSLVPVLQTLGHSHVGYGVQSHHYEIVAAALLWTLEQGLGDDFTDEMREAWEATYNLMAGVMQAATVEVVT